MIRDIARVVARNKLLNQTQQALDAATGARDPLYTAGRSGVYRSSCRWNDNVLYVVGRDGDARTLLACSSNDFRSPFGGKPTRVEGFYAAEVAMTPRNAATLQQIFPFLVPRVPDESVTTSIGFGDRLGLTTPVHVRLAKRYNVFPVIAQQSFRELEAAGRGLDEAFADAVFAAFQEGLTDGFGADADEMPSEVRLGEALRVQPSMYTIDAREYARDDVDGLDNRGLQEAFGSLSTKEQRRIRRGYSGRSVNLGTISVRFRPGDAERAAVKFNNMLGFAEKVAKKARKRQGDFSIELSLVGLATPTTAQEHYFLANECQERGVPLRTVAIRFPGEMPEGADFSGDIREFDSQITDHSAIAQGFGTHRITIRPGEDKDAVYTAIARRTGGRFHLKTSASSWLAAMHTIAGEAPDFYREIHERAVEAHTAARNGDDSSENADELPDIDSVRDRQLTDLVRDANWRPRLSLAYGPVMRNAELAGRIRSFLHANEEVFFRNVERELEDDLKALRVSTR
ncbi:MAG: tagaturonate epimerase family protein [Spirochaetales bacterium]